MSALSSKLLFFILVVTFAFCFTQPAFAHAGEPRLEISVERINPGGTVELRGVDFDYEQLVTLSLTSTHAEIPLNEVTTDVEGTFTQIVVLPADLAPNIYNFQAKTDHEVVTSPTLTVWGVAVEDQESNVIQDQSDVQFEPLPTPIDASASSESQVDSAKINSPRQNAPSSLSWFTAGIGIIILLSLLLGFRLKK